MTYLVLLIITLIVLNHFRNGRASLIDDDGKKYEVRPRLQRDTSFRLLSHALLSRGIDVRPGW